MKNSRIVLFLTTLVLAVFCSASAFAQEMATLNGRITDPNGLPVPGVKVQAINVNTNIVHSSQTNEVGLYTIPSLPPGTYRVIVEKQGFVQIVKPSVELHVLDIIALNFALQIGSVTQSVTVEGGVSLINTTDAAVGTVVDHKYVENMPLNGRSFQDLILLTPGIVTNSPQTVAGNGRTGEFSVSGQRTESNYYTVDGVSANIAAPLGTAALSATAGSLPAATALGTTQSLVSVDAMEEFRVQTSTYSAEYGHNPGGQFSFVTRSGTNQWHGTAFDYLRNDILDANNWFNNYFGRTKPPLRQNDFGGVLGGPIQIPHLYNGKDKTFFFFSYEGLRLLQPQAATQVVVPSTGLRQSAPAPLNSVLNAFPVPNGADLGNGLAQFISNWSNPSSIDSTSIRLDHALNDRLRLFFRFSNTPSILNIRQTGEPSQVSSIPTTARTYTFGATSSLSSRLSNEFRLNYSSNEQSVLNHFDSFGGATPVSLFDLQGLTSTGSPTALVAVELFFSQPAIISQLRTEGKQKQWNIVDTFGLTLGRHQVKVGFDLRRLTPNINPQSPSLLYIYTSAAAVQSNSVSLVQPVTTAPASPAYIQFSAYAHDEWRPTPSLSISSGLRWEVNPAPGATDGNLPYTVQGSSLSSLTLAPQGTPLWKTTWYNFAPRLGVAYILRGRLGWETVLRGGGGAFFDTGQQLGSFGYQGPGFAAQSRFGTLAGAPVSFPLSSAQASPAIINPPVAPFPTTWAFSPHLQLPFTLQWNATVEQALGRSQRLTLSYVGANGRRLLQQNQVNVSSFNHNFSGVVVFIRNGLTSNYNALQVQFQRRLSHGLQALASYTWSHSIDYGSTNTELPYLRGSSDFDVRHNFSSAFSYDVPNAFQNGFARAMLSHWGLDDRFTARTGFPVALNGPTQVFDPTTGEFVHTGLDLVPGQSVYVYGSACTALYNTKNTSSAQRGCPGGRAINPLAFANPASGRAGNAPRNFVRGFGAWQMDLAIRREFPVYERLKLQFRAEAFNIFNHPNYGVIASNYCDPTKTAGCTFGETTQMLATSLGGLSALYQMGGPRSMQFALKLAF